MLKNQDLRCAAAQRLGRYVDCVMVIESLNI